MITFKDFLIEARMAPLYHGTNIFRLSKIIETGSIEPKTSQQMKETRKFYKGVSTTRNYEFAKSWGLNIPPYNSIVVIYLDQQKLAQRYKITPYNFYWGTTRYKESLTSKIPHSGNEYEEFIITDTPIPLKYVTQIDYAASSSSDKDTMINITADISTKYPHIKVRNLDQKYVVRKK